MSTVQFVLYLAMAFISGYVVCLLVQIRQIERERRRRGLR